jgi:ribosomal protein L29
VSRKYYRLFGDLEYDLLSLRAETGVMSLRIREVKRRIPLCRHFSEDDERKVRVTSHELSEHRYSKLETLRDRMASSRSFTFDVEAERQSFYLLADVAHAILGIGASERRMRELEILDRACEAYARLDLPELHDLHERVQGYLAYERRDRLDESEERLWRERIAALEEQTPLRFHGCLEDPGFINSRVRRLRRAIAREQDRLEHLGMTYTALVRAARYRN